MPTKPKPGNRQTLAACAASERADPARALHRIVLTGFMGSGKTTIGALLAERLGWRFLDLDREIEARDGRTVPKIFAAPGPNGGEAHFRRLESATLAALLNQRHAVLALGGGAPEEPGNRLLLEQTPHTAVVYLSAAFDTLVARCAQQATEQATGQAAGQAAATARPNLADLAHAERRFHLRRPLYERIATHTIATAGLTLDQTANAILAQLQPKERRRT